MARSLVLLLCRLDRVRRVECGPIGGPKMDQLATPTTRDSPATDTGEWTTSKAQGKNV